MANELTFTNGFYVSRNLPISHQRCSNCFPHMPEVPSLSSEQLLFTPGISEIGNTGVTQQVNRGAHVKNGVAYFVNGGQLWSFTKAVDALGVVTYSATQLGAIEGDGRVSMADNGTQLMVLVPGGKGYIYNENAGTPFTEITDSDFTANGNPQIVVFIDGYFACSTDSKKWIISALNDGLTWDALDFSSAESDPDEIVAPVVVDNQLFLIGSETTEGVQNNPQVGSFPFQRNNIFMDKGSTSPFSVVKSNSSYFMVGAGVDESPAIWQMAGNRYKKVSTNAVDYLLSTLTDTELSNVFGMAFGDEGHYFISFTLPSTTIVYDLITQKWHERNSVIDETETRWRVNSIITAYGLLLTGDSVDGRIGHLSRDYTTEYEDNVIRLFTTQPFSNKGNEITSTMIELTMESGVGNTTVTDPVVSMSASANGKTFTNERVRKIGKKGEYDRRIVWYKNGRQDRFVVWKFRMSEPVGGAFIKLEYE